MSDAAGPAVTSSGANPAAGSAAESAAGSAKSESGGLKIAPIKTPPAKSSAADVISRPLEVVEGISDQHSDLLFDAREGLSAEDSIDAPLATADYPDREKKKPSSEGESGEKGEGTGRDPKTGRFTRAEGEEKSDKKSDEQHSDDWEAVTDALNPDSSDADLPFEFGGARFRDAAHAAQSFKVLRGHYKSAMKFREQSIAAANLANDWMNKAGETRKVLKESVEIIQSLARGEKVAPERMEKFLNAKLPKQQQTSQPPQSQPQHTSADSATGSGDVESDIRDFIKTVNWEVINELADKHSPAHASAALGEALIKFTNSRIAPMRDRLQKLESELRERIEQLGSGVSPILQDREQMAKFNAAHNFFNSMAALKSDDGSPLYPELLSADEGGYEDPDVVIGIAQLWEQLTDDVRFTQDGFDLAVLKYRRANPDKTTRRSRSSSTPASSASGLDSLIEGQRNRGAAVLDGSRATASPTAHGRPTEAQFTELAAISRAGRGQKEDLGFDA